MGNNETCTTKESSGRYIATRYGQRGVVHSRGQSRACLFIIMERLPKPSDILAALITLKVMLTLL